jgi:hypothetical protein
VSFSLPGASYALAPYTIHWGVEGAELDSVCIYLSPLSYLGIATTHYHGRHRAYQFFV